ncbi:unnamed protein product [Haemonchus placei]|uniref:Uncharacterized protein n=1 Tax=Haemonchus placei TaxID=6290 RepID=A0A0N4W362_HAEPC|nr:unnamed protein product [Haemonchus placei]
MLVVIRGSSRSISKSLRSGESPAEGKQLLPNQRRYDDDDGQAHPPVSTTTQLYSELGLFRQKTARFSSKEQPAIFAYFRTA